MYKQLVSCGLASPDDLYIHKTNFIISTTFKISASLPPQRLHSGSKHSKSLDHYPHSACIQAQNIQNLLMTVPTAPVFRLKTFKIFESLSTAPAFRLKTFKIFASLPPKAPAFQGISLHHCPPQRLYFKAHPWTRPWCSKGVSNKQDKRNVEERSTNMHATS